MTTGTKIFIYSESAQAYPYPPECPFNTKRAPKVRKILDAMGLLTGPDREEIAPEPADRTTLEKFHTPEYLDTLEAASRGQLDYNMFKMGLGTGDCPIFKGVYDHGLWTVGATVTGAERIVAGDADIAFNPSGGLHHAHADRASGFCYVNDQVLGCMTLAQARMRVLYLDIDVHHGDGVEEAFYSRNDVMTISMHQTGTTLFPGTGFEDDIGTGDGKGFSVNIPLPPGTFDEPYLKAFTSIVLPLANAYQPDCFVMEIGADGLAGDPLAALKLTNNVYADIIAELLKFGKPILATGGGGYNFEDTVRAWALAWAALCGDDTTNLQAGSIDVLQQDLGFHGGLRDRKIPPEKYQRTNVSSAVEKIIERVKKNVFGIHGL